MYVVGVDHVGRVDPATEYIQEQVGLQRLIDAEMRVLFQIELSQYFNILRIFKVQCQFKNISKDIGE